jgi:hypothetical protein
MWREWLARTLRPRPGEAAMLVRAPAPVADEEPGVEDVRPSTARLSTHAQDKETASLAADL